MAKGTNQKPKLLYLAKIFREKTDEEHGLSVHQLIEELARYDINADRKTIYLDIEELQNCGMDIVKTQEGRNVYYSLGSREFELAELKLLVDTVQSAKFITERKSRTMIKKLCTLVSANDAKKLNREVIISGRVKTMNESIFYNVDKIHSAIGSDAQIKFQYFQWNVKKEAELRHGGQWYHISPWALIWDDEYYYLIGYDAAVQLIKHFRVDKMLHIAVTDKKREGRSIFEALDLPKYSRGLFGMFGGETERVTLRCRNDMAGAIIDRFGKDTTLIPDGEEHFTVSIELFPSQQFFGWVTGLGGGVKVIAPQSAVEKMRETTRRLIEEYLEN